LTLELHFSPSPKDIAPASPISLRDYQHSAQRQTYKNQTNLYHAKAFPVANNIVQSKLKLNNSQDEAA
jgi:hypothetical protein